MPPTTNDLEIVSALQLAVLSPIRAFQFHAEHLPTWWHDQIGLLGADGNVEIKMPVLCDFLQHSPVWQRDGTPSDVSAAEASIEVDSSPLFEIASAGRNLCLQAIAIDRAGKRNLIIRNFAGIDSWLPDVLQRARNQLLTSAADRSQHNRELAAVSADRDEAMRLEHLKSQFLASMSHEIRTPLTTILGMASLAQNASSIETVQGHLSGIISAANHLRLLSNDILDLSRIEADRMELDESPFSLTQLLEECNAGWQLRAKENGLRFDLEIDAAVTEAVIGDAFRLRQVLTNLVGNAFKFTEHGSVSLHVHRAPTPGYLRFSVTDTGIGIAAADVPHIFDAFTQADGSSRHKHEGAGLGLAIAANLVSLMRGKIEVESVPGVGSTFRFEASLPTARVDSVLVDEVNELGDSGTESSAIRVLVAEDHELNRSIIVETLETRGMEIVEAADGEQALSEWRRASFDVVLMDCQMPIMSGLDVMKIIRREEPEGTRVPIVALTAHAMREETQRLLDHGADLHMTKPFDISELATLVTNLARGSFADPLG